MASDDFDPDDCFVPTKIIVQVETQGKSSTRAYSPGFDPKPMTERDIRIEISRMTERIIGDLRARGAFRDGS